jgi:hypothetical protein
MITFISGGVVALFVHSLTGFQWTLAIAFGVSALSSQVAYASLLNRFLGGADPVTKFGAQNLRELRGATDIPLTISFLSFLARVLGWAGLFTVVFALGWLEFVSVPI